jgi:hypothetical protein
MDPVTVRNWTDMSVAQQQSMHALGFTPRSWELRLEPALRASGWGELSGVQQQAASILGWQPEGWSTVRGNRESPRDAGFMWRKPDEPRPPAKLFPRIQPDFTTLGLFSQPSYTTIADPFRGASEVVERRKRYAASGVCHASLMDRARGKQFETRSPR